MDDHSVTSLPGVGRLTFEATGDMRRQVEGMAGIGIRQDQIAAIIRCDPKTLRKHFHDELERGSALATMKVAKRLYDRALDGDTACLIFWMKARAGWREKAELQINEPIVIRGGLSDD